MSILICPNCGAPLSFREDAKVFRCTGGHSFDVAKEGYVNLLVGSKSGEGRGDSKESARARHAFLEKGYYACLKDALAEQLSGTVLDICCGEGYYDFPETLPEGVEAFYGFDLSKEMVRLAARRAKGKGASEPPYRYFVANLSKIPVADHSIDTALHLFAPFHETEFARVLQPDGTLYSVIPGENHLWELKKAVYDTPYKNDEAAPTAKGLVLQGRRKVSEVVTMPREDLKTCFAMTPYFYRTSEQDKAKLDSIEALSVTVEFVILEYKVTS